MLRGVRWMWGVRGAGGGRREEDKRLIPSYKSDVDSNPGVILQGNPSFRWKNGAPVSERKRGRPCSTCMLPTFVSKGTCWGSPPVTRSTYLSCPYVCPVLGF